MSFISGSGLPSAASVVGMGILPAFIARSFSTCSFLGNPRTASAAALASASLSNSTSFFDLVFGSGFQLTTTCQELSFLVVSTALPSASRFNSGRLPTTSSESSALWRSPSSKVMSEGVPYSFTSENSPAGASAGASVGASVGAGAGASVVASAGDAITT